MQSAEICLEFFECLFRLMEVIDGNFELFVGKCGFNFAASAFGGEVS